jgi:hypothetical protein
MSIIQLIAYGTHDIYVYDDESYSSYPEVDQKRIEKIQKWFKNRNNRKIIKYLKSKEFNEWFFAPDGIGAKNHKKSIVKFAQEIESHIKSMEKSRLI